MELLTVLLPQLPNAGTTAIYSVSNLHIYKSNGRQRQENYYKFQTSVAYITSSSQPYIVKPCFKENKQYMRL